MSSADSVNLRRRFILCVDMLGFALSGIVLGYVGFLIRGASDDSVAFDPFAQFGVFLFLVLSYLLVGKFGIASKVDSLVRVLLSNLLAPVIFVFGALCVEITMSQYGESWRLDRGIYVFLIVSCFVATTFISIIARIIGYAVFGFVKLIAASKSRQGNVI